MVADKHSGTRERTDTLEQSILKQRLHVITHAVELGNVSAACREPGISQTLFYRWQRKYERYGRNGLHPRRTEPRPGRPVQTPPHIERQVLAWSLSSPAWGRGRPTAQLAFQGATTISPSTVQRIPRRSGLATRRDRLADPTRADRRRQRVQGHVLASLHED